MSRNSLFRRDRRGRPFTEHTRTLHARGQSRLGSMMEVTTNYAIGFVVAWATSYFVLRAMGFHATVRDNFLITVVFTAVSMVRSYCVRRFFNWLHHRP